MPKTFYWEDFEPGMHLEVGEYFLSEQELISFAKQYDPQTFHIDPDAAKDSPIGVLCASGIQTMAITQRLIVDNLLNRTALVAGMGVDELRFNTPVLPNEKLRVTITVSERNKPKKDIGKGRVYYTVKAYNPRNELAFSMVAKVLVLCKK